MKGAIVRRARARSSRETTRTTPSDLDLTFMLFTSFHGRLHERDSREDVVAPEAVVGRAPGAGIVGADGRLNKVSAFRATLERVGDAYEL